MTIVLVNDLLVCSWVHAWRYGYLLLLLVYLSRYIHIAMSFAAWPEEEIDVPSRTQYLWSRLYEQFKHVEAIKEVALVHSIQSNCGLKFKSGTKPIQIRETILDIINDMCKSHLLFRISSGVYTFRRPVHHAHVQQQQQESSSSKYPPPPQTPSIRPVGTIPSPPVTAVQSASVMPLPIHQIFSSNNFSFTRAPPPPLSTPPRGLSPVPLEFPASNRSHEVNSPLPSIYDVSHRAVLDDMAKQLSAMRRELAEIKQSVLDMRTDLREHISIDYSAMTGRPEQPCYMNERR
jgi:hypothetical protein